MPASAKGHVALPPRKRTFAVQLGMSGRPESGQTGAATWIPLQKKDRLAAVSEIEFDIGRSGRRLAPSASCASRAAPTRLRPVAVSNDTESCGGPQADTDCKID